MKEIIEPIRIEIPLGIMFQSVNCYLIPGKQLTLIDCGLYSQSNWGIFQKKIKEHGYKVDDIEQIIITHEHRDHIGLLPEIIANSNAIVRVPKMIKEWFSQPDKKNKEEINFTKELFTSLRFPEEVLKEVFNYIEKVKENKKFENLDRFEFFEEGDFLEIGNTQWEVLNTPGHCPSQFVFLQKEQKRIFGSDMLLPIAPMPIKVENPNEKGQPVKGLVDLLNSFERLQTFNIQTVYPGHGSVFTDANAMIDKQLDRMEMRKEECYDCIKSGLNTLYHINRKMYSFQKIPPDFSGLFMVLGYIDLLEQEEKIVKNKEGFFIRND